MEALYTTSDGKIVVTTDFQVGKERIMSNANTKWHSTCIFHSGRCVNANCLNKANKIFVHLKITLEEFIKENPKYKGELSPILLNKH